MGPNSLLPLKMSSRRKEEIIYGVQWAESSVPLCNVNSYTFCPDLVSSAFLLEISSLRACTFSLADAGHVTNCQQFLRLKNFNSRQQLNFLKSEIQPGIDPKLSY